MVSANILFGKNITWLQRKSRNGNKISSLATHITRLMLWPKKQIIIKYKIKRNGLFCGFLRGKNINRSERKKLNSFKWRQRYDPDSFLDRSSYIITTFFSDTRQPELEFLHSWAVILNKNLRKLIFSKRVKTLSKTNLIASRHINPLSPNSDQDQFSPNNIHTLSRNKLWELIKWSPKRKCLDLSSNSLN